MQSHFWFYIFILPAKWSLFLWTHKKTERISAGNETSTKSKNFPSIAFGNLQTIAWLKLAFWRLDNKMSADFVFTYNIKDYYFFFTYVRHSKISKIANSILTKKLASWVNTIGFLTNLKMGIIFFLQFFFCHLQRWKNFSFTIIENSRKNAPLDDMYSK